MTQALEALEEALLAAQGHLDDRAAPIDPEAAHEAVMHALSLLRKVDELTRAAKET